jgi:hypothetical protein
MSNKSAHRKSFVGRKLREVREGQILKLAGARFAVVATQRQPRLIQLDLEAEDGAPATLLGVPGARVRLHEGTGPGALQGIGQQ